jgi:DNA-binding transcriptional LysR family regulator
LNLENVRAFVKVAELRSFTRAAEHLRLSKARVSAQVRDLEAEVGGRLLQRSTRSVRPTGDGEQFLVRARRLVTDADELSAMFQAPSTLRGQVRIDMPVSYARDLFLPRMPELLALHPQLELLVSATDRRVDVLNEGFDCVVRVGELTDSGLTVRRLGSLAMVNCATPAYLLRHGTPRTLTDLDRHFIVHYSSQLGAEAPTWEYPLGDGYAERPMQSRITVNNTEAYYAACLASLGIAQMPRVALDERFGAAQLVEVLPDLTSRPLTVSLVHPHGKSPPKRVAAVMSWLIQVLETRLRH